MTKSTLWISLSILCLLLIGAGWAEEAEGGKRPPLFAHYYTWYTTGFGPQGRWGHWGHPGPSEFYPQGCDPERIIFSPSIRQIASCAYPLVGPYDSDNREVVRWHIRLAKAAGIDAFSVDWWGDAHWQTPESWTRHVFEDVVLPVAEEEDFKVFLFDETPEFYEDLDESMAWAVKFLKAHKDSPAYLHIDGQPVYAIYQRWDGRLTLEQGRRFIETVEREVGDVYWIIDKIVARAEEPDEGDLILKIVDGWEKLERLDAISLYATFSSFRKYDPDTLRQVYRQVTERVHRAGKKIMLPVHPGMDNRKIQLDEVAQPRGLPHWFIPRKEGRTLRDYLAAVTDAGVDYVAVTSFNEWPETTVVEPALTWPDPYRYLKILAEYRGKAWSAPKLPTSEALDPVLRPYLEETPAGKE